MIKILFIGDIVGTPGITAVTRMLKETNGPNYDFIIANIENAAGGFGVSSDTFQTLSSLHIDCFTSGNHIWDKPEGQKLLVSETSLLRPANYPPSNPGFGWQVFEIGNNSKIAVINLQGRVYMTSIDCPFRKADQILEELNSTCDLIFVDFHADASSEKQAMGWYLDGRVSAVVGTHTHVQTADESVSERGTAYITDVGMTGPHDSIIGMAIGPSLGRFLTSMPKRFTCAKDDIKISGVLLTLNGENGAAENIERFVINYG